MAHILIIGATSGIGLETVKAGVTAGHTVRAFARSAATLTIDGDDVTADALQRFAGDARDPNDVREALDGIDCVVHALGLPLTFQTVTQPTDLFSQSTRVLLDLMADKGVRRLIAVTGIGAGDARDHLGPLAEIGFNLVLKQQYDDKDVQEQMIRASSGVDWTIVRPGILTNGPATGHYQVLTDPKTWRAAKISRADVADFIVTEIATKRYVGETPVLID